MEPFKFPSGFKFIWNPASDDSDDFRVKFTWYIVMVLRDRGRKMALAREDRATASSKEFSKQSSGIVAVRRITGTGYLVLRTGLEALCTNTYQVQTCTVNV